MMQDETRAREVLAAEYRKDGYEQMADGIERGQSPATIRAMLAFAAPPAGEREEGREARAIECLARLCEREGNKGAAFTLRKVGAVGTVLKSEINAMLVFAESEIAREAQSNRLLAGMASLVEQGSQCIMCCVNQLPHDCGKRQAHPLPADREAIAREVQRARDEERERCAAVVDRQVPAAAGGPFSHTNSMRVVLIDAAKSIRSLALSPTPSAGRDGAGPNYTPFASREECETGAIEAVRLLEYAEEINANCEECEGEGVAESCGSCMPMFDAARVQRRLVMQSLAALPPSTEKGEK